MSTSIRLEGEEKLRAKLSGRNAVYGEPVRKAFLKAAIDVEGGAKRLVHRDTGHLQQSITHRIDGGQPIPKFAEVGTNVAYGRWVHFGRRAGSRMPPVEALRDWARRHGMAGKEFLIARAIARKGIKPNPFLTDAAQGARKRLKGYFEQAAKETEGRWGM